MKVSRQQTPPSQSPPSRKDIYFFRKWGEETAGGGASPEASERRQRSIPTRIMIACPNAAPSPALQPPNLLQPTATLPNSRVKSGLRRARRSTASALINLICRSWAGLGHLCLQHYAKEWLHCRYTDESGRRTERLLIAAVISRALS